MEAVKLLPPKPLSKREEKLIVKHEAYIEENLRGFKKVGCALMAIRDQFLYRIEHDSFEDYCRIRWDFSRSRAYQFIDAYKVIVNLCSVSTMVDTNGKTKDDIIPAKMSTIVDINQNKSFDILPANESQARPLVGFTAEKQVAIWMLVLKTAKETGSPVTAILIQQCTDALFRADVKNEIKKVKSGTTADKVVPSQVQLTFTAFLDEVQNQADENWNEVSRKKVAGLLRSLLKTIEN